MPPRPKRRVFLDSNVIFSGFYSAEGAPGLIVERFIAGELQVVISQQVLEEVVRAVRGKLPQALPALRRLLVSLSLEIRPDPSLVEAARWVGALSPGDAAILAAAASARPDCLITGDRRFLAPGLAEAAGLRILTPAQFLAEVEGGAE